MAMETLTRSARDLARALAHRGELARKLRKELDRTVLWKLSAGKRLPELSTAVKLHKLSHGRISVFGWLPEEPDAADQSTADPLAPAS
jgi:hypothetical protein